MKRTNLLATAGLTLLLLAGCKGNSNEAAKDPVTATKDIAAAIRANDYDRLSHIIVPPDLYAKLEAKYKEEAAKRPAASAEEQKQFTDQMTKLTAADAEDKMFAEIQPKLAQIEPQAKMMVPMVAGMAGQGIQSSTTMSAAEKTQASALLTAVTKWATTAPFSNPDKAKEAIKAVVKAARDLKLNTLEEARALSLPQAAQKMGIAAGGLRNALAVYGFDTDKALASFEATKVSETGDNAVVKVNYMLMDTPITYDVNMVKRDGRWYSADAVKNIEQQLAKPAEAAVTAPVMTPPADDTSGMDSEPSTDDMSSDQMSSDQMSTEPATADDGTQGN
ncbi:MAG: hypothetical protein ABIQ97_00985 [Lysobacteraceae bacterium]